MLQSTFEKEPDLRVPRNALGIFGVAVLAVGLSLTGLLCFAIRETSSQADNVFLPAWCASVLGLLTIFYDFLTNNRYSWNTPALLYTIAAAVGTIIYSGLLIYTHRKTSTTSTRASLFKPDRTSSSLPLRHASLSSMSAPGSTYQDSAYYSNYIRNMYPTSQRQHHINTHNPCNPSTYEPGNPNANTVYDSHGISEEEMQRQQMLMLLLQREQAPTPDPGASTFHIDWQGHEAGDEEAASTRGGVGGFYAPSTRSGYESGSSGERGRGLEGWRARHLPEWDRVWRGVVGGEQSAAGREARRREIEMGMRG
ncbi:hypothetical protein MBLNU230_g7537t1 [Neophaeotheca triangularis]